jgi:hypothetical protein
MGHMMAAGDVRLVDVPTKKIVNADVIRSGEYVFIKYTKSQYASPDFSVCRIYTTEKWAFPLCLDSWPWQREFMTVLVKLKLMTKERQAELIEIDRQRTVEKQRKYDLEDLKKIAGRNGFEELERVIAMMERAA